MPLRTFGLFFVQSQSFDERLDIQSTGSIHQIRSNTQIRHLSIHSPHQRDHSNLLNICVFVVEEEHLGVLDPRLHLNPWKVACVFLGSYMIVAR